MIREARERRPPALRAGHRNFLARLRRAAASSDASLHFCERGAVAPLSHFPPGHAGSEQSSLPLFLRARQYSNARESRGHGAPVSDRHRAGARNPHQQRCAPPISLLRTAHRRSALNRGDDGHGAPVSDRHRAGARNPHQQRCAPPISLLRTAYRRSALNRGDMERRSPTGIAREREGDPHQQRRAPPDLGAANGVAPICVESGHGGPSGLAEADPHRTLRPANLIAAGVSPPAGTVETPLPTGSSRTVFAPPDRRASVRKRTCPTAQRSSRLLTLATPARSRCLRRCGVRRDGTIPLFEVRLARRAARGCAPTD